MCSRLESVAVLSIFSLYLSIDIYLVLSDRIKSKVGRKSRLPALHGDNTDEVLRPGF